MIAILLLSLIVAGSGMIITAIITFFPRLVLNTKRKSTRLMFVVAGKQYKSNKTK